MEKLKQYFKDTFLLWIVTIGLTLITIGQEIRIYKLVELNSLQTDSIVALDNRTIANHNFTLELGETNLEILEEMLKLINKDQ